ncbi:MAG: preprotein translocase subunit SecE [Armatimonadetes bacterium]|nr:preprotein translocase subunit SecE [Armatimonadota bacterium]
MRRGVKGFYRDVVREMKHVTWPKPHETTRLTGVVLAVCVMIVTMLYFATFIFGWILSAIITGGPPQL